MLLRGPAGESRAGLSEGWRIDCERERDVLGGEESGNLHPSQENLSQEPRFIRCFSLIPLIPGDTSRVVFPFVASKKAGSGSPCEIRQTRQPGSIPASAVVRTRGLWRSHLGETEDQATLPAERERPGADVTYAACSRDVLQS